MRKNYVEICGIDTSELTTLTEERKRELLLLSKGGDRAAREELIVGNLRLVLSVISKFASRGESANDLFQVGCIGLIKAIDNFNTELDVRFSTYAVPMMFVKRNRNTSIGGKFVNEHPRETPYYKKSRYLQGNFAIREARKM